MQKTALLIIDVQLGLDAPQLGKRNNLDAETNMTQILKTWRHMQAPVIHVKHNSTDPNSSLRPGQPGNAIKACVLPAHDEKLIEKKVNSAFIGTDLEAYLNTHEIHDLVIIGLTTDHCVSTTVRMAANLGFRVRLIEDATASFERKNWNGDCISAEQMHAVNIASLNNEFCKVLTTQQLLDEMKESPSD